MSNSLDPDQARHFVGPDLDPNCLQRLSADDRFTCRQKVKYYQKIMQKHKLVWENINKSSDKNAEQISY